MYNNSNFYKAWRFPKKGQKVTRLVTEAAPVLNTGLEKTKKQKQTNKQTNLKISTLPFLQVTLKFFLPWESPSLLFFDLVDK